MRRQRCCSIPSIFSCSHLLFLAGVLAVGLPSVAESAHRSGPSPTGSAGPAASKSHTKRISGEGGHALPKYQDKIIFVGQLPYNATQGQIERFFARKGLGDFTVRMLTDKTAEKKFRGIAFVEFQSAADVSQALKLDHHLFGNRRIRIERTATGGGNSQKRKGRLLRSKVQQDQDRRRQIESMLDRIFRRRDSKALSAPSASESSALPALQDDSSVHPSRRQPQQQPEQTSGTIDVSKRDVSKLMARQDCDDLLLNYLCSLPDKIASKAARACSRLEVSTVENRGAFAMGMVKNKLRRAEKKAKKRLLQSSNTKVDDEGATLESPLFGTMVTSSRNKPKSVNPAPADFYE